MLSYIAKRLLGLLPTLVIVGLLVFLFVHLLPGDPARLAAGPDATPETVELVRKDLGLDRSLPEQFVRFVARKPEFMRLMNFKIAWEAEQDLPMNPAYASSIKVFGTEFYMEACRLMLEVMGQAGTLRQDSPEAVLGGRIEFLLRGLHILTFGGGVNELQRDLIALFGLSMPVMPRF